MIKEINFRDVDKENLKREIKNYNRRLETVMKKGDSELNSLLPPKMSYKDVKSDIFSRRDYNAKIRSLQRFTAKTAVADNIGSISSTAYEKKELQYMIQRENALKKQERSQRGFSWESGSMGTPEEMELRSTKLSFAKTSNLTRKNLESILKRSKWFNTDMGRLRRMQLFKDNYIKAVQNTFGDKSNELVSKIKKLSVQKFYDLYYTNHYLFFEYIYDDLMDEDIRWENFVQLWSKLLGMSYTNKTK